MLVHSVIVEVSSSSQRGGVTAGKQINDWTTEEGEMWWGLNNCTLVYWSVVYHEGVDGVNLYVELWPSGIAVLFHA